MRLQYRVQSLAEQNQRVVNEDDLRPAKAITEKAENAKSVFSVIPVAPR
jgi:hypothetical protein